MDDGPIPANASVQAPRSEIVSAIGREIEAARGKPLERSSRAAMIIGLIIIGLSVAAGLYFALSPLIRGQGFAEFFNFLIVPLGLTGLAATPGALLFLTARHVRRKGASLGAAVIMGVIALPWLFYAGLGLIKGFAIWQLITLLGVGSLALIWAIMIFKARTVP